MTTTTTSRQPAGTPGGGQFAASAHAEAGIDLAGPHQHLTEDEFDAHYGWVDGPDDVAMWLREPSEYPANRVWTVLEDPTSGVQTLVPGSRESDETSDRLGWIVSVNPWPHQHLTVEWWDPADFADEDEQSDADAA